MTSHEGPTRPGVVLIHGGLHTRACWHPVIIALRQLDGDLRVFALNLPGRADVPGDLALMSIATQADSAVQQIECARP